MKKKNENNNNKERERSEQTNNIFVMVTRLTLPLLFAATDC